MGELIIILLLLFAAVFLMVQWRKAFETPEKEPEEERKQGRGPLRPQQPATSYEDILRELQPKVERKEAHGRHVVGKTNEKAKEPLPSFPSVLEEEPRYKSYEKEIPKAVSLETERPRPTKIKQVLVLEDSLAQKRLDPYANEASTSYSKYGILLRNPATARDAVILSEIFHRKYS